MQKHYFCYSSALDTDALNLWKQQHGYPDLKLDADSGELCHINSHQLVFNFASKFWGGRVAGIKASNNPSNKVYGILFSIDAKLWQAIEHKEGVMTGVSIPLPVTVQSKKLGTVEAVAFTTNPTRESYDAPLSTTFLQVLLKAYKHWGFPQESIAQIQSQL